MTSRERILAAAAKLFQRKGYSATGLNEILAESGAPKGSLYYYFPRGKLQLAIEAVAYAGAVLNGHVAGRLAEEPDAATAFQRVVADIIAHFSESEPTFGDISLSLVALSVASEDESLRKACALVFDERQALFVRKLTDSGRSESEARRIGSLMQILIEGAIVAIKTQNDLAALEAVAAYIPYLLEGDSAQ